MMKERTLKELIRKTTKQRKKMTKLAVQMKMKKFKRLDWKRPSMKILYNIHINVKAYNIFKKIYLQAHALISRGEIVQVFRAVFRVEACF